MFTLVMNNLLEWKNQLIDSLQAILGSEEIKALPKEGWWDCICTYLISFQFSFCTMNKNTLLIFFAKHFETPTCPSPDQVLHVSMSLNVISILCFWTLVYVHSFSGDPYQALDSCN
jgi:hypothetical protein